MIHLVQNKQFFFCFKSSQISDNVLESIDAESYLNKNFKCRVLSLNLLDGLLNITMKPSILERKILFFSDVQVGSVYEVRNIFLMNLTRENNISLDGL